MATITPTVETLRDGSIRTYAYETLTETNADGSPINEPEFSRRSVQVLGDFGSSGALTVQGSNDGGTTWATLNDPQGDPIVLTSAGIVEVQELAEMIRPAITAGTGVDLDCYILINRPTMLRQ